MNLENYKFTSWWHSRLEQPFFNNIVAGEHCPDCIQVDPASLNILLLLFFFLRASPDVSNNSMIVEELISALQS